MRASWAREVCEPSFLASLERLRIGKHDAEHGFGGGGRGTTVRSSGLEWIGYRRYRPGDDLRHLDWNAWARLDAAYVRMHRAEANGRIDLLVDSSPSMRLGAPDKGDIAAALAFVIGHVAVQNGARVGALRFADRILDVLAPGRGRAQTSRLLHYLSTPAGGSSTEVSASLKRFAADAREVGRAVVLSDLIDSDEDEGLAALRRRGFEVTLLRVRAHCDEQPWVDGDPSVIVDSETASRQRLVLGPGWRRRYTAARRAELERTVACCRRLGVEFADLGTWRSLRELVHEDLRDARVLG